MAHPTIRRGSTGSAVVELQELLTSLGYYHGSIDSIFGAATEQAVLVFQRDYGLMQDGVVGPRTWAALDAATGTHPTLRIGDRGPAVRELQMKLQMLGYYFGSIDSIFGPATQQAVIAFQRGHGLKPDGVVGHNTWAALDAADPVTPGHPTIRVGSTGWAVVELEEMLTLLSYYNKPLDSKFGEALRQAVVAFQRDYCLVPDGVVGPKTWTALDAAEAKIPSARIGDKGPNVQILQMKLQILGYYLGPVNSLFDAATRQSVLAFQRDHHLTPDGVVGRSTWHDLIYDTENLPTLRTGNRGIPVRNLQLKLRLLGYYGGAIDSVFGEATRQAVSTFQRGYGLTPDGVVGRNTWAELEITTGKHHPTLRIGDRGPAVQELQMKLRALGYYFGAIDSIFGPATRQAVIAFQRNNGLVPDGVVGPATWAALDRAARE